MTAAALASENKLLAHPASVDSLPTSANQEDHVSMATHGARRLHDMADNTAAILGIELLAAAQGIELRKPVATSPRLQKVLALLRDVHRLLAAQVFAHRIHRRFPERPIESIDISNVGGRVEPGGRRGHIR